MSNLLDRGTMALLMAGATALVNVACVGAPASEADIAAMDDVAEDDVAESSQNLRVPEVLPMPTEPTDQNTNVGDFDPGASWLATCLTLPEETADACASPQSDCIGEYVWATGDIDACTLHDSPSQCATATAIERFDFGACQNDEFFPDTHVLVEVIETELGYRFDEGADKGRFACELELIRHHGKSELCASLPMDFSGGQDCESYVNDFATGLGGSFQLTKGRCPD